jgi:hypothetical protein
VKNVSPDERDEVISGLFLFPSLPLSPLSQLHREIHTDKDGRYSLRINHSTNPKSDRTMPGRTLFATTYVSTSRARTAAAKAWTRDDTLRSLATKGLERATPMGK